MTSELPVGPEVKFEVQELDFSSLVQRIVEIEREKELSSLEMFSRYVAGDLDMGDSVNRQWLGLFLLWLVTGEVRAYSEVAE